MASQLYLSNGDPHFSSLFSSYAGGPEGFEINFDESGKPSSSLLVSGTAGTGKTTLACQIVGHTLLHNNAIEMQDLWPSDSGSVVLTLDQPASELKRVFQRLFPDSLPEDCIDCYEACTKIDKLDNDLISRLRASLKSKLITIIRIPYNSSMADVSQYTSMVTKQLSDSDRIRLVMVDSINAVVRNLSDGDMGDFRNFIGHDAEIAGGAKRGYIPIVTFEEGEQNQHFPEEFLVTGVVSLSRDIHGKRERFLEIKKARFQHHYVGLHEFFTTDTGLQIFPATWTWADKVQKATNIENSEPKSQTDTIDFGLNAVDHLFDELEPNKSLLSGSATLLTGKPGTGKSDLMAKFLAEEWKSGNADSSVLLMTWKRAPANVFRDLASLVKRAPNGDDLDSFLNEHFAAIDMRNPYYTGAMSLARLVEELESRKATRPINRAALFGVSRISESPEAQDEQWRFLSVVVAILKQHSVSSLLVDWPRETRESQKRPSASMLCSNEIETRIQAESREELGYSIRALRANYNQITDKETFVAAADLEVDLNA